MSCAALTLQNGSTCQAKVTNKTPYTGNFAQYLSTPQRISRQVGESVEQENQPQYAHQGTELNQPSFPSTDDIPAHSLKDNLKQDKTERKILANTIKRTSIHKPILMAPSTEVRLESLNT